MTWSNDLAKIYNYEAQQNIIEFNKRKTKQVVWPKNYKPGKVIIPKNFMMSIFTKKEQIMSVYINLG